MQNGTLDNALETQGGLSFYLIIPFHFRGVFFDKLSQLLPHLLKISPTCPQHIRSRGVI